MGGQGRAGQAMCAAGKEITKACARTYDLGARAGGHRWVVVALAPARVVVMEAFVGQCPYVNCCTIK